MRKHVPWSKRKTRIKSLWDDRLGAMDIHCNAYTHRTNHSSYKLPRYWILIDKDIIWDFPSQFLSDATKLTPAAERLPEIQYWLDNESFASFVLDEYVQRSVDQLFEPFEKDEWELGDILRAADRRLGKRRLLEWAKTLHPDNPAHRVLALRFSKETP